MDVTAGKTGDYVFFALCLFLIWAAISNGSEDGLLHRWRVAFDDLSRDFRGSKIMLIWVSLTVAMGR